MGRNINTENVNKNHILNKVSQVTIFATYFNISPETIQYCIDSGNLICSPIREDIHPSFGFRYDNRGRLKGRDFAGYFWGDCFDAAAFVISRLENKRINIANKSDFIYVLKHIMITHKQFFYGGEQDKTLTDAIKSSIDRIRKKKPNIELVVRDWNKYDEEYWQQFGVNLIYLNRHFVYPVDQYYIERNVNPEPKYYYDTKDPCYAYLLGHKKGHLPSIKLYFPNRPHGSTRFITNANHLEGIYNLYYNDYDYIVLTKSTKDRLSLGCTWDSLSLGYSKQPLKVGFINIPHETYRLREFEYKWMISKLNFDGKLISLMDNDRAGLGEAYWLRKTYNIQPIIIPKELGAKDFAELRSKYDITQITNFIKDTLEFLNYEKDEKLIQHTKTNTTEPF